MPTLAQPQTFDERSAGFAERTGFLRMDPVVALAGIGLVLCSIVTLAETTRGSVAGDPYFFTIRQSIYAVVGIALMFALARFDYSRFRELRVGIYAAMIFAILAVMPFGDIARGSRRSIDLPFFSFQPSELVKLLLVIAL